MPKRKFFEAGRKLKHRQDASNRNSKSSLRAGGGPAVLFTCATGCEGKVRREVMQLFDYYVSNNCNDSERCNSHADKKHKSLSIEDEIKELKQKDLQSMSKNTNAQFSICRDLQVNGTVLVQCNIKDCIPFYDKLQLKHSVSNNDDKDAKEQTESNAINSIKKEMIDASFYEKWSWDPVNFVRKLILDAKLSITGVDDNDGDNKMPRSLSSPPSSRFISRCIPLQATCYPSLEEITKCAKPLLKRFIFDEVLKETVSSDINQSNIVENCEGDKNEKKINRKALTSFSVVVKRRLCNSIDRMEIVDAIAQQFDMSQFKVNIKNPDYAVVIEICKTLCGIAVVRNLNELRNFNLQEIKQDEINKK